MPRRFLVLCVLCAPLLAQQLNQPLPAWTEGTLDVHQINTGRGNATLFILPDGTSMLLDAGDLGRNLGTRGVPAKPDASRPPGEWIARYAARVLPAPVLDYALLTHFHDDHVSGMADVGTRLPIRKMLDRGWPDYESLEPYQTPMMDKYRAFLKQNSIVIERFTAGRADQIVLRRAPQKYPNFQVRNVLVNTEVWTGVADSTRQQYPPMDQLAPADRPDENRRSLGFKLSYGNFDYGTFGDIPGRAREGGAQWEDMESAVAKAVGPLEAVLLNHHGNRDSTSAFYLASLRPQVLIDSVWSSDHPSHDVLERILSPRIYPGPRDVFATSMSQANKDVIGPMLDRLKSSQGHILIRVEPGGDRFRVIIIDDSNEAMKVLAVHGPYQSR